MCMCVRACSCVCALACVHVCSCMCVCMHVCACTCVPSRGHLADPPPLLLTPSLPSWQPSSSAARASSSAQPASAPTLPSSVMGTMTAKTTATRPIVVRGGPDASHSFHSEEMRPCSSFLSRLHCCCSGPAHPRPPLPHEGHGPPACPEFSSSSLPDIHVCLPSQFKCTNTNRCIPGIFRCNGQDNCGDGEDERDCRKCQARGRGRGTWAHAPPRCSLLLPVEVLVSFAGVVT